MELGQLETGLRVVVVVDPQAADPLARAAGELGQVDQVLGPEHEVEGREAAQQRVALLLGDAAADADQEPRLGALALEHPAQLGVELVLRLLPDRARVDDDQVGRLGLVGAVPAVVMQQVRHLLGVVLVHLAAEALDVKATAHGRPR